MSIKQAIAQLEQTQPEMAQLLTNELEQNRQQIDQLTQKLAEQEQELSDWHQQQHQLNVKKWETWRKVLANPNHPAKRQLAAILPDLQLELSGEQLTQDQLSHNLSVLEPYAKIGLLDPQLPVQTYQSQRPAPTFKPQNKFNNQDAYRI